LSNCLRKRWVRSTREKQVKIQVETRLLTRIAKGEKKGNGGTGEKKTRIQSTCADQEHKGLGGVLVFLGQPEMVTPVYQGKKTITKFEKKQERKKRERNNNKIT